MSLWAAVSDHALVVAVWGLAASGAMATSLEGAQLSGVTRMSLPFLFGAFVTDDRRTAVVAGYGLYILGGWLFAVLYALVLGSFEVGGALAGAALGLLLGFLHGLFLVTVFLPLLPFVHPRLASDFDGPEGLGRIEPPGPFGLNYGRATPLTTIGSQTLYGLVFGTGYGAAAWS